MSIFNFKKRNKQTNTIEYIPNVGFIFESKRVEWKMSRKEVREKLSLKFKEDDNIISIAQYFDGDKSHDIQQKRDIYENVTSDNDLIFIHYNSENRVSELEVHYGYEIKIDGTQIDFETDLAEVIKRFKKIGIKCIELEKGNYLLPTLKITIADRESLGGEGKKLSYFYCSTDISHLTE